MKNLLKSFNAQGILITDLKNLMYLSGFRGDSGVLFITEKKKYLITIPRHESRAIEEVGNRGFRVVTSNRKYYEKAHELMKFHGITTLAVEDASLSYREMMRIKETFSPIKLEGIGDSLLKYRMVKSPFEIEKIRKACEITSDSFSGVLSNIKKHMTELHIGGLIEANFKKLGAEDIAFRSIIASKGRSALPHAYASSNAIEDEGFLLFDIGSTYEGYASDMTRTIYIGSNPTREHLDIYNTVLEACNKAISIIKPGVTTRDLDKVSRDYIIEAGYGDYFDHGLGHGVGIDVHEYPSVSHSSLDTVLEEGMVITIEPGIYIEGFGGVRIEDTILVTKSSHEVLTKVNKELISISI